MLKDFTEKNLRRHSRNILYQQNESRLAIADFLNAVDEKKNRVIDREDINDLSLIVFGYGWGGTTAVDFCNSLSHVGQIKVGGSPKNPLEYRLNVPIPVPILFALDVNPIFDNPDPVSANVTSFLNIYQTRGGDSIFNPGDASRKPITVGTPWSALVKGVQLSVEAPYDPKTGRGTLGIGLNFTQLHVARDGYPFGAGAGKYVLGAGVCGHDGLPFLALPEVVKLLKNSP